MLCSLSKGALVPARLIIMLIIGLGVVAGCETTAKDHPSISAVYRPEPAPQSEKPEEPAPAPRASRPVCRSLRDRSDLDACSRAADQGDVKAAYILANAYSRGLYTPGGGEIVRKDLREALLWHAKAYELGGKKSLRYLFQAYYYGVKVKQDRKAALSYLEEAASLKQHWALIIKAAWAERKNPKKAWGYYMTLARDGNCHAQEKLAQFYMYQYVKPANYTMAYFWGLVADKSAFRKRAGYHRLAGPSSTGSSLCGHSKAVHKAKSMLSKDFYRKAQKAAQNWQTGDPEPRLPAPAISQKAQKRLDQTISQTRKIKQRAARQSWYKTEAWKSLWEPVQLPQSATYTAKLEPTEIFSLVNNSVWTVLAANSKRNMVRRRAVSTGSGVAISVNQIITNYHVVKGRPYLQVHRGKKKYDAKILYFHKPTDRCVLLVQGELEPVTGYRSYKSLKVGEVVYSVGSPRGLENTLGQGLISGLRYDGKKKRRMIQTNAQISKGSSGGGLFDRFGNLIGITTMKLKDAESLNFAISVEDFTKP